MTSYLRFILCNFYDRKSNSKNVSKNNDTIKMLTMVSYFHNQIIYYKNYNIGN